MLCWQGTQVWHQKKSWKSLLGTHLEVPQHPKKTIAWWLADTGRWMWSWFFWGFPKSWGIPIAGWLIEKPIAEMIWRYPHFRKPMSPARFPQVCSAATGDWRSALLQWCAEELHDSSAAEEWRSLLPWVSWISCGPWIWLWGPMLHGKICRKPWFWIVAP